LGEEVERAGAKIILRHEEFGKGYYGFIFAGPDDQVQCFVCKPLNCISGKQQHECKRNYSEASAKATSGRWILFRNL
jgi:hypothetical protein